MAVGGALGSGLGAPWSRVTLRHFAWQAWHKLTSTIVSRGRRGTNSHPPSFRVAGVAQTHIHLRFAWQAWHNLTSTSVLRGRRGTHGSGWRAWVWFGRALVVRDTAPFCVAGLAQTHIHPRFAWQRGANSQPPSFRVAGVALMAVGGVLGSGLGAPWSRVTPRHFAWQAWHKLTSTIVSRGRRGTNSHPPSFCVAGVAQTHIHLRFTWQAWHNLTSTSVLRGRRGTHGSGWRAWVWFGRALVA